MRKLVVHMYMDGVFKGVCAVLDNVEGWNRFKSNLISQREQDWLVTNSSSNSLTMVSVNGSVSYSTEWANYIPSK